MQYWIGGVQHCCCERKREMDLERKGERDRGWEAQAQIFTYAIVIAFNGI